MTQRTRKLLATAYYTLKTVNDGLDAKYVIINGEQVFKYSNNFSGTPTPATITLTATKFNITANGKWQYKNGTTWTDFSPAQTSTTLSLSPTSGILNTAKSMQVRYIVDTIYDEITIVKVSDGANGTSATAYWLISSASAIGKNTSNVFNPASITFSSKSQTGNSSVVNYSGRFIIAETTDGTNFTDKYTSTGNESSKTYTPSSTNVKAIRVRMYKAGGTSVLLDEQLIPVVTDGKNGATGAAAVTAVLSNDSHSIPCNTSGTPSTYAGAVTTMSVFVGATDTSTSWTYTATPTNVTGTLSNNNRTYTVTGITADTGYVDITATRSGYSSVTKRFTLAKSKQGNTGAAGKDAYTVILSNESHTFPGSTSAALAGSTTCGIIAYKGATKVNASIGTVSGIPTGMTVTPVNNNTQNASLTIAVTTSMTTKNGTLTIPITVDGKVFNKNFSYALALKGNTGATGPQGPTGPTGPQGPQGEAKDYYDATFMDGKKYWSTAYTDTYTAPGTNVVVAKEATSKGGGNVLQIQNDTWLYARNKIAIEEGKIYKFSFRVRQIQDPLNGADKNKIYAGATTFNAAGDKLSPNNGTYFIATSQGITVANGWKEYTVYMSTTARAALVSVDKKTLCPAVKAFDVNTKAIKPMFIVNYSGGNGIAQVDYLTVEDYTQEWNALNIAKDKLNNNSQQVFDALTNNGKIQGIYMENNQLYVNGQYINAKNLRVVDTSDRLTFGVDESGNVTIRATTLEIGTKPVASQEHVSNSINNIQVGGRNLMPNTGFYAGLKDWAIFNSSTNLVIEDGRFGVTSRAAQVTLANQAGSGIRTPYCSCTPGTKYVASFWVKVSKACKVGQLLKFKDSSNTETNPINVVFKNVSANTWTFITQAFTAPSTAVKIASTPRIDAAIGADATFLVTEFKLEEGTKATTWSPSPEDIDNDKISTGDAIEDINNTPEGQIQYPKLNIKGQVNFTDFDPHLAKHYNVKKDAQGNIIETVINGATIATGSVTAEQMSMYNLSVVRRKKVNNVWQELDTSFNINEEGHVRASGTFSSFNFNEETRDKGWQIDEKGDSVFNNTIIRGRVELPNAGVTDYGGGDGVQILVNSNFADYQEKTNVGWDNAKNGTLVPVGWGYYNSGVTNANTGYHAHLDIDTFGYPVGRFINKNSEVNQKNRWMAFSQSIPIAKYKFKPNTKYTFSMEIFADTVGMTITGGLHHRITGSTSSAFSSGQFSFKTEEDSVIRKKWQRFTYTFTTHANYDAAQAGSWYVYGHNGVEGIAYIKDLKLEEGEIAHAWSPEDTLVGTQTRMWAGESYEKRDDAPFRVLHNGTVIATRGEFGGTFTGRIEIGNIKIYDTNNSEGVIEIKNKDDKINIVRVGEEQSYFNSSLFIGTPDAKTGQHNKSFEFSPVNKKMQLFSGSSIVVADTNDNRLSLINNNNNGYIKFGTDVRMDGRNNELNITSETGGRVTINIGNFADSSSHDDASLTIDGSADVKNLRVACVKIYENPNGDGIDFFVE